jgi:hypothetical protein
MHAKDILANLLPYQSLLKRMAAHEHDYLSANPAFAKATTRVRTQYDFITLWLSSVSEEDGPHRPIVRSHCEIRFKINGTKPEVELVHCEEKPRISALEALVKAHVAAPRNAWNPTLETAFYHSDAVTKYLAIADVIAGPARNCVHGDNYRPGNFSEIAIDDEFIVLSQINRMNAKSLAHKNDYALRELVFTIPLGDSQQKSSLGDTLIGEMRVCFSDSSSDNNRACGKAIAERIAQAQQSFAQS